jgi:hypothetical protein
VEDENPPAGWRPATGGTSPDGAPVMALHALDLDRAGVLRGDGEVRLELAPSRLRRLTYALLVPVGAAGVFFLAVEGLWWPAAVLALLAVAAPAVGLVHRRAAVLRRDEVVFVRRAISGGAAERLHRVRAPEDAGAGSDRGVAIRQADGSVEVLVRTPAGWVAVASSDDPARPGTLAEAVRDLGEPPVPSGG